MLIAVSRPRRDAGLSWPSDVFVVVTTTTGGRRSVLIAVKLE